MSNIIKFPGAGDNKEEEVTTEKLFATLNGELLKEAFVVGIRESGEVVVSGNCTIAHGIYLAEVGKHILIEISSGSDD